MQEHPTLFDAAITDQTTAAGAPRCRMCARPARWNRLQQAWSMYCSTAHCSNRDRICQSCGTTFHLGVDGAGTKYCSTDCKRTGYTKAYRKPSVSCAWCGKISPDKQSRHRGGWPYICRECMQPIKHVEDRLKKHHVSPERARVLVDDPHCECCGADVVSRIRDRSTGVASPRLVVDHDHTCCPGATSCGACVRGLICHHCNVAAGMLNDDPDRAAALAKYLERFRKRAGANY